MKTRYLFGLPFLSLQFGSREIEAVIDTGFSGELMLPQTLIQELGLEEVGSSRYILADGSLSDAKVYAATVSWFGRAREVLVISSESDLALAGLELLHDSIITICPAKTIISIEPSS